MKTLRRGDRGGEVRVLQSALVDAGYGVLVDGLFGRGTENAVERFQQAEGLLVDGIVGRVTWGALGVTTDAPPWQTDESDVRWHGWRRVDCDMTVPGDPRKGFDATTLRNDVAQQFEKVRQVANDHGAIVTSAGGRRRPKHTANKNQSQKSLHTVGRAHDLALPSGMSDPRTDPYIIEPDPLQEMYWVVWARAEHGEERMLNGWVHSGQRTIRVHAKVINLTELFAKHGFERIRARRSYSESNYGAAEWWHLQYERGLEVGVSTYGEELLKVWRLEELEGTTPWEHRDAVWGVDWF